MNHFFIQAFLKPLIDSCTKVTVLWGEEKIEKDEKREGPTLGA